MNADKVLKGMLLTEKANKQSAELGQYTFEVGKGANKHAIAEAVEATFKVTVRRVNTQNYRGKKMAGDANACIGFRSRHVGGATFARCDGSVAFFSECLDFTIYQAMSSRAGGEVIPGSAQP